MQLLIHALLHKLFVFQVEPEFQGEKAAHVNI